MSNFQYNVKIIRFVADDILRLYDKFGYNEFLKTDTKDIKLTYSLKKLTNYAVIDKHSKVDGRIKYKLSKFVVDACVKSNENYERKHRQV